MTAKDSLSQNSPNPLPKESAEWMREAAKDIVAWTQRGEDIPWEPSEKDLAYMAAIIAKHSPLSGDGMYDARTRDACVEVANAHARDWAAYRDHFQQMQAALAIAAAIRALPASQWGLDAGTSAGSNTAWGCNHSPSGYCNQIRCDWGRACSLRSHAEQKEMYDARLREALVDAIDELEMRGDVVIHARDDSGQKIIADAVLAAIRALPSAPVGGGWVLVPREPTPEMFAAAWEAISYDKDKRGIVRLGPGNGTREWWAAMLATAPIAGDGGDSKTSSGRTLGTIATGVHNSVPVAFRKLIADLIRSDYDPVPDDWPGVWGAWDDGAEEIADKIIEMFSEEDAPT